MKVFKPNNIDQSNILSPSRSIFDIENDTVKDESRITKIGVEVEEI